MQKLTPLQTLAKELSHNLELSESESQAAAKNLFGLADVLLLAGLEQGVVSYDLE